MKKIVYIIVFCIMLIPSIIFAKEKEMNMYLFYGDGCPHCAGLEKYLNQYLKDNPNIKLYKYEVWYNEENRNLLKEVYKITGTQSGIPYLIIGNNVIVGFAEDYTEEKIKTTVNYYKNIDYEDKVGIYLGIVEPTKETSKNDNIKYEEKIEDIAAPSNLKKLIKNSSLIITSIAIGLVDGFNPCAMWILILLITMLLGITDKKRKWILGISFLLATGAIYFAFLISWLNLSIFLNSIAYIRLAISCVAVLLGFFSIIKFIKTRYTNGCVVVNKKKRKKIIVAITKIIKEKSFVLAVVGIVLLAFAVNIIELLCSLGLPAMFAQVLAINNISMKYRVLYSIVYVLAFLIDDLLVFFISMKTLEIKAISNKYGKYASLISGIIMMIIGFLMLYKPEWLMLNF